MIGSEGTSWALGPATGALMKSWIAALLAIASIALIAGPSHAADEPGSRDHPLIGRYQGSSIAFYKAQDFDEIALLKAPHDYITLLDRNDVSDRSGAEWLKVEGRVTKIRYAIPEGRSSLEVMRNYESALKAKGFDVEFTCTDRACFRGTLQDPYLLGQQLDPDNVDTSLYSDHVRYALARFDRPEGRVHAAILTGDDKQQVTVLVTVVEEKPMERDKIAVLDAG